MLKKTLNVASKSNKPPFKSILCSVLGWSLTFASSPSHNSGPSPWVACRLQPLNETLFSLKASPESQSIRWKCQVVCDRGLWYPTCALCEESISVHWFHLFIMLFLLCQLTKHVLYVHIWNNTVKTSKLYNLYFVHLELLPKKVQYY